jgi:hypothetical protein
VVSLQASAEEIEAYLTAMLQLLEDTATWAPKLFVKQGAAVAKLCTSGEPAVAAAGARILAAAGRVVVDAKAEGARAGWSWTLRHPRPCAAAMPDCVTYGLCHSMCTSMR